MPKFWLAYAYIDKGEFQKAKDILINLLNKGLATNWIYGNLGIVDYRLKNYDSALNYFFKELSLNSPRADTYYFIGVIYLEKNDFKKAKEFLLTAIKKDDTLVEAKEKLAFLYSKEGKTQEIGKQK